MFTTFVDSIPAQRVSVNCPRKVAIVTPTFRVAKNKYRDIMVITVILAIKDKWPDGIHNMSINNEVDLQHE